MAAFGAFLGFAYFTPVNKRLYKEIMYSLGVGVAVSYSYLNYYKYQYIKHVDQVYDHLK